MTGSRRRAQLRLRQPPQAFARGAAEGRRQKDTYACFNV